MCRKSRGAAECDAGQARQHHRRICWPGRRTGAGPADDQWLPWGTWEPGARTLSWPRRSERLVGSRSGLLCWASWEPALQWRSWSIAGRGGTWHCSSDLLNRAVKTGASWSAHDLRVAGDTLSGPDAFLGFWLRKKASDPTLLYDEWRSRWPWHSVRPQVKTG